MRGHPVQQLLDRLNLSDSGTVYFFSQESKWKSIVPSDTAKKLEQIKPTAFYMFNNQPYILFFDLSGPLFQQELEQEIHKKIWSFDQSPLAFILKDGDVEIYNAFSYEKKKKKLEQIKVKDEQLDHLFSFWNIQSGNLWTWLQKEFYKDTIKKKRVNQKLFDNIKEVREKLIIGESLSDDQANTLILRLIFVRYLIDRNVKLPEEFISGITIDERRISFIELIGKPRVLNTFFGELNDKFNGVLFKDVHFELSKKQALQLSHVFSGETPEAESLFHGSEFFFEIFDFSIIPVELISGIYESLIDPETRKLNAAVYTPSFLVEYILSETVDKFLDKHPHNIECKIFDPSVGSGIFLVQGYRRMVEKELEINKSIKKIRLREIAVNNLFGIDIEKQALKVTCFSIYIAMLDYIDPASILTSFKFPDLIGNNLFEADFFDTSHPYNDVIAAEGINFLLGNPPWKSDKSPYHLKWLKDSNVTIARFEIAQSFLLRSKAFMNTETVASFIVTSTIFYNIAEPAKVFKQNFLTTFCLNAFFDLSPVRRLIFEEKDNPCAVVLYHLSQEDKHLTNTVYHSSVKSNIFLKYFKSLVIEKFDQKRIPQKLFIENDWMFKVALYGNTLDFALLKRLPSSQSLKSLIDGKTVYKGAGIKSNKGKDYADFLIGLPLIENANIKDFYTPIDDHLKRLKKEEVYFESGRAKELFFGHKILIKEQARNESELVISYVAENSAYKNGVWGISSENADIIKQFYAFLISDFYTYFIFITACSWGVGTRPQIRLDEEYLAFPIIIQEDIAAELITLTNEFLNSFQDFYSEGFVLGYPNANYSILNTINKKIEELYSIKPFEKDLIDYVLKVSRYQFQESKQRLVTRKIHSQDDTLPQYIDVFLSELSNLYTNEYLRADVYILDYFIAVNFVFQSKKPRSEVNFVSNVNDEKAIFEILSNNISITSKTESLFIQKDIKGFEDNSFYIVKPNEYKCWHRAMAWYDMAEIKAAIEDAEINHLTETWNAS